MADLLDLNLWVCDAGHLHVLAAPAGSPAGEAVYEHPLLYQAFKEICRDERGRFAPCGGGGSGAAERETTKQANLERAHSLVRGVLHGERPVPHEKVRELADHLTNLTVQQLHEIRKSYGLRASGANKAALKDRLVARLATSERRQAASDAAHAEATAATAPAPTTPTPAAPPPPPAPKVYDRVPEGTFGKTEVRPGAVGDAATRRQYDKIAADLLGPGKTHKDLISAAGCPDGAREVNVTKYAGGKVAVDFSGSHKYKDENGRQQSSEYHGSRTFRKDPDGSVRVHNDYFRGEGVGKQMFGRQVENAVAAGVKSIDTHAAGQFVAGPDPNKTYGTYNGYYTWPRYGYDAKLPDSAYAKLTGGLKEKADAGGKMVSSLMGTDEGRKWWLRNGSDLFHADFDLTPGSKSLSTFTKYLQSKKILEK